MIKKLTIYLDFDGTVVEHQYPQIGRCNFGCFEVIKKLQDAGHNILLNTYRSESNNPKHLDDALKIVNENYWMLIKDSSKRDDFNLNPIDFVRGKIYPDKFDIQEIIETGKMFIDDQAYQTPLKNAIITSGKMVDWDILDKLFEENGFYIY